MDPILIFFAFAAVVTVVMAINHLVAIRSRVRMEVDRIRPLIQMDGGEIYFVSLDEETGVVQVELAGACVGCPASSMTLKAGVERILKDRVPGITEVIAEGVDI